ncbi:MAG: TRAM domain-containing protein [Acidimicrobiia bacterium]|nr:TRAM domain-containing protein [Acidimicrobiia bacterium]
MIIEIVRLMVTLATTAAGFLVGRSLLAGSFGFDPDAAVIIGSVLGAGIGYVGGGLFGRSVGRGLDRAPMVVERATGPQLFAGAFGVLLGIVVGAVVSLPLVVLTPWFVGWPLAALLVVLAVAFSTRVFTARATDLLAAAGLRPKGLAPRRADAYLLDTSAIIDGRVLELCRTGLVTGDVWVPEFVLGELQAIADSGDHGRRRRGRRGLEVLEALRDLAGVDLRVAQESVPAHEDVDAKLAALADAWKATLVTTDSNLARVASLRGIAVLNPHVIGDALRPAVAPGETITLLLEKEGSEDGQAVGYLDDGTMVVVEAADDRLGETVVVEVANALRTSVGRLLFGRLGG